MKADVAELSTEHQGLRQLPGACADGSFTGQNVTLLGNKIVRPSRGVGAWVQTTTKLISSS